MMFPRSHIWSPFQKWLVAAGIVAGVVCVSAAIYAFEHYYGLPSDSVLVGTWQFPPLGGGNLYFQLNSDHTFSVFSDELAEKDSTFRGVWFGGGKFVYFRRSTFDEDGYVADRPLLIWRLESISANELHVRLNPGGIPRTVRRVSPDSPSASNQSLQPTVGRRTEKQKDEL
jgi:hypothetical protein